MSIDQGIRGARVHDDRPEVGVGVDRAAGPRSGERSESGGFGVLALPATWVVAWALALGGVHAPGYVAHDGNTVNAIRWMLYLPAGWMFMVSSVMHTVFARKTARLIGWQTNGFQYELGFVSLGLGIAGVYASSHGPQSWIAVTIPTTTFLFFAGVNHVVEMVRKHNFHPGNTIVCVSDFGLPISLWALLLAAHAV
ncbi:MAG: hypothetical protein JO368_13260 [Acidimicrobiales bacterium]|nr:hypothetical protein [Acidimicrobiales bacterium]